MKEEKKKSKIQLFKDKILQMITNEIAIAHKKDTGGKTSRLTSLYMKITKINI